MLRVFATILVLAGFLYAMEMSGVKVEFRGNTLSVNGKSYTLGKNLVIESPTGERLNIDALNYARAIRMEFNKAGEVIHIKILGWWD